MSIAKELLERNQNLCELCNVETTTVEYTVSPKADDKIENQVALCETCVEKMEQNDVAFYWRCLEGSIWSPYPSVQALSYRILNNYKNEPWVSELISSVDLDEATVNWALSAFDKPDVHKDAYGNILETGDNIVLTQALNVKGTSFTAQKGTVVKKIKLVGDNPEQIEGRINEQTIVILTKFVKKG